MAAITMKELIIIRVEVKQGIVQGVYSNLDGECFDVAIIDRDVQTEAEREEVNRRAEELLKLKTIL